MTRRMIQMALLALAAAAGAVEVTPATASGYIFTVPVHTNHIRGIVMGWPPEYRAIRSEDIDWLREAWGERYSLQVGRLVHNAGVGGEVARDDVDDVQSFRNGWPRMDDGYLDPDTTLLDGVRLCRRGLVSTNVWSETCYTNGVTNSYSTIVMEMTNGTTSVYTNAWTTRNKLIPYEVVTTNVHAYSSLDWCQPDGAGVFAGLTNTPQSGWGYINIPHPTVSAISNAYEILRRTTRLADVDVSPTNSGIMVRRSYYSGGSESATTNNANADLLYELQGGTQYDGNNSWANESQKLPFTAYIMSRFTSELCTTGGASRVAVAGVYAAGSFYYLESYHPESDDPRTIQTVTTNFTISISGASIDVSTTAAVVAVPLDMKSICSAVVAATGAAALPADGVRFTPSNGIYKAWECAVSEFVIIYTITPSVKLPDW